MTTTDTVSPAVKQDLRDKADFYARKFGVENGAMQAALHDIFSMLALSNIGPYVDPVGDVLTDLRDRCHRAADTLLQEEDGTTGDEPAAAWGRARLAAERSGVKLAISYIDETIRGLQ
jgi:hypothetical protein